MFEAIAKFRQSLSDGQVLIGAGVYVVDPQSSDALSDSVDFLWYDQEHSTMSLEALRGHIIVARNRGKPAIVRISELGRPFIKPVLDSGADGIVVPQVKTADEVKALVEDCRYPPLGKRGLGPTIPTNYWRYDDEEFFLQSNMNIFASIMIETVEAVENIDEILAVPGLDSIVIGPSDLAASLGVMGDINHPKVEDAMNEVIPKAKAAGVFVGAGMGPDADWACVLVARGVQWLQLSGDLGYMLYGVDSLTSKIKTNLRNI